MEATTALEKSEAERKEVKRYAADLVDRVKREVEQQEFMVDRRMINKFLVNYVNPGASQQTRMQMLDAMSKILAFTIEEKQVLGLAKKQGGIEAEGAEDLQKKGIGEKLINFFLMDDEDD